MRKTTPSETTDEVDQLLQAAHDDVLLKLSLNSHIARAASHSLDSDLSRRFRALKSPPSAPKPPPPPQIQQAALPPQVDDELTAVLGDDLSARFAALRGSINPSSSLSSSMALPGPSVGRDIRDKDGSLHDDEEDEVEKIIRWAKDAARLDPSPPSDEDAGDKDEDTDSEKSSDDGEGSSSLDKKAKRKMNRPKWFPRSRHS